MSNRVRLMLLPLRAILRMQRAPAEKVEDVAVAVAVPGLTLRMSPWLSPGLTLRMVQPWHRSGRLVVADAGMASMATLKACADVGLDFEGNVKGAHRGLCKEWLMSQVKNRGDRASAMTEITTEAGEKIQVLAAIDMDKQPMTLISTGGTTTMGAPRERRFKVIRSSGDFMVRNATFEQWDVHSTYRANFNTIDKHNAKRQGGTSFEDTWKTHRWWVRDFQVLDGMSEVNAFLLWNYFRPECDHVSLQTFRRQLGWQLLHNKYIQAERATACVPRNGALGNRSFLLEHTLKKIVPNDDRLKNAQKQQKCRYCCALTLWNCTCASVCVETLRAGKGRLKRNACMFVCSTTQSDCFARHLAGEEPPVRGKKRSAEDS
ncbi:hypothetical protein CYMTET_14539 [Cymbomonas tetramitiformis]|uniref:PiggyBac transposable element-derived protein domain-containing protein n=1 Tax=Cymbomonas tetramitiformis TaxID=36881 RepID=A0AAE0L9U2_9CHLO|nr:hypothetical protein CYMTET_14539 [Cymbomonas tetramitiformis]